MISSKQQFMIQTIIKLLMATQLLLTNEGRSVKYPLISLSISFSISLLTIKSYVHEWNRLSLNPLTSNSMNFMKISKINTIDILFSLSLIDAHFSLYKEN